MTILIVTKSGREHIIETQHDTPTHFIEDAMSDTDSNTWLNFGKIDTCVYSGDLVIKKDEIESFLFNYKNSITRQGY